MAKIRLNLEERDFVDEDIAVWQFRIRRDKFEKYLREAKKKKMNEER